MDGNVGITFEEEAVNGKAIQSIISMSGWSPKDQPHPYAKNMTDLRTKFETFLFENGFSMQDLIDQRKAGEQMTQQLLGHIEHFAKEFVDQQQDQIRSGKDRKECQKQAIQHTAESMFQVALLLALVGDNQNACESAWKAATLAVQGFAKRIYEGMQPKPDWELKMDEHGLMNSLVGHLFPSESSTTICHAWVIGQECHRKSYRLGMNAQYMLECLDVIQKLIEQLKSMPVDEDDKKRLEKYKDNETNFPSK